MKRFLQAASDLKLSAFRNDLPPSFEKNYLRVCRIRQTLNAVYSLDGDITEEDAAYLREMLTRAEVEAAEKARRRHERVKWISDAMVAASRRLFSPFN